MKVAVIIVSYNGELWLQRCLDSVFASSIDLDVIVVDNCSQDNTHAILKTFANVTVLNQSTNLGFGAANNIGMSYALQQGAEYVFLMNQDVYLQPNTVEALVKVIQIENGIGILSPIHLNGIQTELDLNFSNYLQKNKLFLFDAIKGVYSKDIYDVPFVNAAGWLISSNVLKQIGGFDPLFYHYGEDVNFCQRLLFHGFKIAIAPNIYLHHDREQRKKSKSTTLDDQLKLVEKKLKVYWADINQENENEINLYKQKLKKAIFKQILQLKFKELNYLIKELQLVNRLLPEIKISRSLNKSIGAHYLELNSFN